MTLASDILSQRASLIMSEREAVSLAAAPIRTAVARWRAALARALSGKRSAVDLQNAQRYAQLLREAGHATDQIVKQFESIVRKTYATAYGRESFRWASAFEASTGYSFTGIAAREAAIAASGPLPGLSELVSFRNLAGATQTRMASDVATAIAEGWSAKDLVTKWASGAGAGRIYRDAEALARTSLMAASNQAAVAVARQQGRTISGLRWLATFDVRTCFPEMVLVTTSRGRIPIRDVAVGDLVLTGRRRWRRVTGTPRRRWSGVMVTLSTGDRSLTSTWDHAVWSPGSGWVPAIAATELAVEYPNERAGLDLAFRQPQHTKPMFRHPSVASGVEVPLSRLAVPVVAVGLDDERPDQEVDRPPPDLRLIRELDAAGSQILGDRYFDRCRALAQPVAAAGAILAWGSGFNANDAAARGTRDIPRRSAARLGTVPYPVEVPSPDRERGTAAGAHADDPRVVTARFASGVPSAHRRGDPEPFPAIPARLHDCGVGHVAPTRTEPSGAARWRGEHEPARLTGEVHTAIVPRPVDSRSLSWFDGVVYCLEVEEDETFFADGVLVHNCPYCGSRHGKVYALDQLPAMPAHLNCRCVWVPVFANVRVEQENRRPTVYRHNPHANAARQKSFETWLRKQPKGHQLDFFGSELKRDLWRRRKVSLDDLTAGARTLTDAELKTLGYHADSFK